MIAVTASRHFNCNTYIAMWCCLALVNTDWAAIAARIAGGETVRFLGIPMAQTTYTSTVLPPLFLVLVLSYVERFLEKRLPDVLKAIGTPFASAVIMAPLTILVIGPISDTAANGLAVCYNWLAHTLPVAAALVVGGLWQIFVIFGIHWGVTPMNIANFSNNHCDTFQAFQTCAVVAQAAACFGVYLKSKKKENKNVALSAGVTGIFGITGPAIYGVTQRLKKPFIAGCIGGGIGAVIISLFGTQYYAYAGLPGLLTTVNAICPTDPGVLSSLNLAANPMSFPGMMTGTLATMIVTVALVMVIGCGEEASAAEAAGSSASGFTPAAPAVQSCAVTIYAPLNGEIKPVSEVNDSTFAEGILGQGATIIPSDGKLYAPFDCTVASLFDARHAINLEGDGVEMLIHIGLETVTLNGRGFTPRVKDGDVVKAGDLLIEFDLEALRKNFDTITPILVTNADDVASVEPLKEAGTVKVSDPILTVKR